jgi:hypothetical protein
MAEQPQIQESPLQKSLRRVGAMARAVWRRVENIVFGIVLFFIVLYLVLQMPPVQNWLVGKITAYLSEELHTKVELRNVNISFFDNLVLEGLYVEDLKGDTLLYAGEFVAGLNSNIFSFLSNKLEFNEISLKNACFNLRRAEGEYDNNLQFLLDFFSSEREKPPKKPSPFRIRIQNLRLSDVEFLKDDEVRGQRMHFRVSSAVVRVNNLDIPSKVADVRSVDLDGFSFKLEERPSRPLPPRVTPVAQAISSAVDSVEKAQPRKPFLFSIERFSLTGGYFSLDKYGEVPSFVLRSDVMDYEHLKVRDIDIQADSLRFDEDLVFRGILRNLSAREKSGFELSQAKADRVVVCDTLVGLYGAKIQTPGTSLGDTVALHYGTYRDFKKFTDRVRMEIRLAKGSKLRVGDITYFSEGVANNPFFAQNLEEVAEVSGLVFGKVNNLRGQNLDIVLDEKTNMKGSFIGDNLADSDGGPMILNFEFEPLRSDFSTISRIIPGFSAPEYFFRLGQIGFRGRYDIFYGYDHVVEGDVTTDLGGGKLDMKLDLSEGKDRAVYSGELNMREFDLAAWTGNQNFGPTTFRVKIEEPSSGLSLKTINAHFSGSVDTFLYKGYNYQNVSLDGKFKEYVFEGKLGINDDNIKFDLNGEIDLKDSIPIFDFSAKLTRLDLGALNLVEEDWIISADIDRIQLNANNVENLVGVVELHDFMLLQDHEKTHRIDNLTFASNFRPDRTRFFRINSDILDGELAGNFSLATVGKNLAQLFTRQHPAFAAHLGLPSADSSLLNDDFTMWMRVKNTADFTHLFSKDLDTLKNIYANARVEAKRGYSQLFLNAPKIKFGNIEIGNIGLAWHGESDTSFYNIYIPIVRLSSKDTLPSIHVGGYATEEDLRFSIEAKDPAAIVESVHLDGVLSTVDSLWEIKFNASEIALFNTYWYMDEDNYIRFGKNYFEPRNFDLASGDLRINLEGTNNGRGLRFSSANFDLGFLNEFVKDTTLNFHGRITGIDLQIQELSLLQNIEANIEIEDLFIKNKSYGGFYGYIRTDYIDAPLEWNFTLQRGISRPNLRVRGAWLPSGDEPKTGRETNFTVSPGEFQTRVSADSFQLAILETIVPEISKTAGQFSADATLNGTFEKIAMKGEARIHEGQFQLDYLKTMFHINNQKILLTQYQISADKDTVWDATFPAGGRNMALIQGGLTHNHFRDWGVNCIIESQNNNFMVLNTLPEDNNLYYGQGIGKFTAAFTGTFARMNIVVDATTGKETRLYIPITTSSDTATTTFIKYKNQYKGETKNKPETKSFISDEIKGLNFEMNLTVTEDAEVQIIFDEKAGDIIKGRGEGDITFAMNRSGEFKMYGSYQIRRGEYLFTLLNWVNKPFTVLNGGTINWYGDPYGAQINLDATYEESTSLYNFLRDEIELLSASANETGKATLNEARKPTKVIVTMHLKGDLMKPTISFDLEFPNISSQLKSYAENKLRLIRQDPNELNRQVFGLVVVGSFLPANSGAFFQEADYLASAFNTLTQMLSNQFSNYLTGLATEWFGGTVSSIDFDVAYNEYQTAISDPNQSVNQVGRELQVRLTSGFANDRVTIQVGSQFGLGRPGATSQDGFLGEDVTVEIQLTENRQWRLKVYQRVEPDLAGGQRRSRYGFGVSFRKDYESFDDMMSGLGNWFKKGAEE